jgi:hypothetical protein
MYDPVTGRKEINRIVSEKYLMADLLDEDLKKKTLNMLKELIDMDKKKNMVCVFKKKNMICEQTININRVKT